jgi:hypothetical protein
MKSLALTVIALTAACGDDGATETPDAPVTSIDAAELDASIDAAPPVCVTDNYPISFTPTAAEKTAVEAAADTFFTDTAARVTLDELTLAVVSIEGAVPLTIDGTIANECDRAAAAVQGLFTARASLFRMPEGMAVRQCSHDDLLDREIVRISGGTYFDDRAIVGGVNDLVMHVDLDDSTMAFYAGGYTPALERTAPATCETDLARTVVGEPLEYTKFSACQPMGAGEIAIDELDTRTVGDPALYIDEAGNAHLVRTVEVLLDADRVTPEQINSDLYCCTGPTPEGCVGNFVVVDELTGEVLRQIPRCHTC